MAGHAHTQKRCRFCRVVIEQCRCIGPHETVWSACGSCLGLVANGQQLVDVSQEPEPERLPRVKPSTVDDPQSEALRRRPDQEAK